jgi:D-glycero-alpha-D-manno-heptose-7-phosphate kinase
MHYRDRAESLAPHRSDLARHETHGIISVPGSIVPRAALPSAAARASSAFFSTKNGFHADHRFRSACRSGNRRLVRDGRGICAALDRLTGAGLRREDWIHISRDIEAVVIRVPTGTQDHYPPAFGGAAAIVLAPGGERREALGCDLDELERRLVLCYTGKPRQHGINNWEVFKRHIDGDRRVARNLEKIAVLARQVRTAIERGQWSELGRLVQGEWEFRRRNLKTISTPLVDRIISSARRNGALAGKVCGAGGGGCLTLVIDPEARTRVEQTVIAVGGTLLPLQIDREGVFVRVS